MDEEDSDKWNRKDFLISLATLSWGPIWVSLSLLANHGKLTPAEEHNDAPVPQQIAEPVMDRSVKAINPTGSDKVSSENGQLASVAGEITPPSPSR